MTIKMLNMKIYFMKLEIVKFVLKYCSQSRSFKYFNRGRESLYNANMYRCKLLKLLNILIKEVYSKGDTNSKII